MTARPPRGPGRVRSWALGLPIALSACCVAPPRDRDLLAVGFRTPEQAFATFQTAVRADDLSAQYRCLSGDFVRRNGLSELAFREFWDQMEREQPLLRKGIADARAAGPAEVRRDAARLRVESHGRAIRIDLVREDFAQAWQGGERRVDEAAPFRERSGVQTAEDGTRWIFARMPVPEGLDPAGITEVRVGREWKIDGFETLDADAEAAGASERGAP